jgi:hypothetical protein
MILGTACVKERERKIATIQNQCRWLRWVETLELQKVARTIGPARMSNNGDPLYGINTLLLPIKQWQSLLPDRPCAQHVQSTCRMSLTVKRPSTKGLLLQLV